MAINTLAAATLFMTMLDKVAVQEATTGWMDANAGRVIYNGGNEVKIPKMSLQGMGDYDRDNGYTQGSVTLNYQTKTMTRIVDVCSILIQWISTRRTSFQQRLLLWVSSRECT